MKKEIKAVENRGTANYIRGLQYREKIKTYINSRGYVCYDTEELENYKKSNKRGRPLKRTNVEVIDE